MSLPIKPMIAEALLVRGESPYTSPIEPGEIYAWEPDLPHARELVLVTRIHGDRVGCRNIDGGKEVWNEMDRFREAVVPTLFNPWPAEVAEAMTPRCCNGGPQWGHAWDCKKLP